MKRSFNLGGGSSRRNFLRGAGVCLTLPWLEALLPRQARGQALEAPLRFLPIYFPNGAAASFWTPEGQGSGDAWSLSPLLEPFAALKQEMTVISNLENYSSMNDNLDVEPSHARCTAAFLTCRNSDAIRESIGAETANGVSLDQYLAQSLKRETTFASLQLGLSTIVSGLDGRHASYSQSISWAGETEPLYKEVNPQIVFDQLVGALGTTGGADPEAQAESDLRRALNKSVLDAVLENAKHTRTRLGAEDQRRLDQFLNSVREVELQVDSLAGGFAANCTEATRPGAPAQYGLANGIDGYDKAAHSRAMNDLIVMALSCDATRIVSHMLEDARCDFVYDHLQVREFTSEGSSLGNGQVGNYHASQHAGDSNNGYATINWWQSSQVADLCSKMHAIDEGGSSLLDNSVVLYGSGMHGSDHNANALPLVLLGGGGGRLKGDQHLIFDPTPNDRPLRDLYYTLSNDVFQIETPQFGENVFGAAHQSMSEILV